MEPINNRGWIGKISIAILLIIVSLSNGSARAVAPELILPENSPINGEGTHRVPSAPQDSWNVEYVGHIGGVTNAVAAQGDYAYIGEGPQLTILEVSNPASATVIGKTQLFPDFVYGLAVSSGYAYVADSGAGLRIIDVSDPAAPFEAGSFDTPGSARDLTVLGSYAYVADVTEGLRIIDVSDPTAPFEVGFYDTPGYAYVVAVVSSYAYVADYDGGLRIIDVSDPTAPYEAGFYDYARLCP